MKMLKKILSAVCVLAMLVSVFYIPAYATIEPGKIGAIDYYKQEWNGKEWLFSNMVRDATGTKEQMSYVNENGFVTEPVDESKYMTLKHILVSFSQEDGTILSNEYPCEIRYSIVSGSAATVICFNGASCKRTITSPVSLQVSFIVDMQWS